MANEARDGRNVSGTEDGGWDMHAGQPMTAAEALRSMGNADGTGPLGPVPAADASPGGDVGRTSRAQPVNPETGTRVYGLAPKPEAKRRSHAPAVIVAVVLAVLAVGGVVLWGNRASLEPANETQAQQPAAANENVEAPEPQIRTVGAGDVLPRVSSLAHGGTDVSLPTEGTEVDVLGGRVLVSYTTTEDADALLSRLTGASAELAASLSSSVLSDSSTSEGGVSQVPAAATPGAIATSTDPSAASEFEGLTLVARGSDGRVSAAVTLSTDTGLGSADEAAILGAADSYAISGTTYAASGLSASGVAQTKGAAPALLTGEAITIDLALPRRQSSSSNANGSVSANRNAVSGANANASGSGTGNATSGSSAGTTASGSNSRRRNTAYAGSGTGSTGGGTSSRGYSGYGTGGGSSYPTSGGSASDGASSAATSTDAGSSTSASGTGAAAGSSGAPDPGSSATATGDGSAE